MFHTTETKRPHKPTTFAQVYVEAKERAKETGRPVRLVGPYGVFTVTASGWVRGDHPDA